MADLVAADQRSREDTIHHNGSTRESVGGYVGIGDGQVGNGPDGCVCRSSEKDSCVEKQRSNPCHDYHC